jgi:hypothetical protein
MTDSSDIFFSYAHADAHAVRPIVNALEGGGLHVYFDENAIDDFDSIQRSVEKGLSRCKALLAYYSRSFPKRRACQWELTTALLCSPAKESQPRIFVINPEPSPSHIYPVELRDTRFLSSEDPSHIATSITT